MFTFWDFLHKAKEKDWTLESTQYWLEIIFKIVGVVSMASNMNYFIYISNVSKVCGVQ